MVRPTIARTYTKGAKHIINQADVKLFAQGNENEVCNLGVSQLSITNGKTFNTNKILQEEVFGPHALLVICEDQNELEQILENIPRQLTFSIFQKDENIQTSNLFYIAQEKAGRVILNGFPSGVGTDSIEGFLRGVLIQK